MSSRELSGVKTVAPPPAPDRVLLFTRVFDAPAAWYSRVGQIRNNW